MPIDLVLDSRSRELTDGFKVRRVLPSSKRRMVGPFIFVDQMGPEVLAIMNSRFDIMIFGSGNL